MERTFAETAGFGLKAGYERMISDRYSAGAEFAFISSRVKAESFNVKISSIDAGIHGRFYPFRKFFYLQAGFGIVSFNIDIDGSTGALDQFKENFDPYTGVGGSFDAGIGYRLLIGGRFIIDASITSGLYLGNTI
ncbi:MAG: autotransporter outer membrane beta-barrel domain-containing protein, partial [Spirochaetaceae bacterium]|nr:autotransporter outer membrane beta-barrel domain-containing protein [Spirochaetaceae bacterium]